ncbi:DUF3991 domain-containing protein [Christensenellaceae bacterium OttesenSCG-928-M15]|nr:DUF3991 domain-containing protein [Christensenellaceae bacterium OttesenSCG-928-M15]
MNRATYDRIREAGYTKEQITEAKAMSAIEYMQRYMPHELVRCSRGEYQMRRHDSFKINEDTSLFHWKSRDIGGKTALDFMISVLEYPPEAAIRDILNGEPPEYEPRLLTEKAKKPFALPEKSSTTYRVERYLQGRGISKTIIDYCVRQGILYEDVPYHNAVFVGGDMEGKARYAFKRGTFQPAPNQEGNSRKAYKGEVEGSEKSFGFYIPPSYESNTLAIYEASVDAMSHASLLEDDRRPWRYCYRLAIGGVTAPKEGVNYRDTSYRKPPGALEQFLKDHPDIRKIQVCLDNDFAGCFAADRIISHYKERYEMEYLPPDIRGDYNDLAIKRMEEKHKSRTEVIRSAHVR